MSNVLGTLFGDIAGAIREKTGDTATMKPAEFPEKIASIEGGGGGSLPAGAYWMQKTFMLNVASVAEHFVFGNSVYVFIKPTSSSTTYDLYEYAEEEYKLIYSGVTVTGSQHLEYNGKIHSIGNLKEHYVFNGKTQTKLNTLPGESSGKGQLNRFVMNGNLYVYATGKLYVWDESTDTWTDTGIIKSNYTFNEGTCFAYNNTVYRYKLSSLYKHVDGVQTLVKTFDTSYQLVQVYEGTIYYTYQRRLYSYDIENDNLKYIGIVPNNSLGYYVPHDGKLRCYGRSDYSIHMQLYEVTE